MAKLTDELCPRCFIGKLALGRATFTTLYQGRLLTVADADAFTCDICDYREFADARVEWFLRTSGHPMNPDDLLSPLPRLHPRKP
mgnify:CR=1 FL=1